MGGARSTEDERDKNEKKRKERSEEGSSFAGVRGDKRDEKTKRRKRYEYIIRSILIFPSPDGKKTDQEGKDERREGPS